MPKNITYLAASPHLALFREYPQPGLCTTQVIELITLKNVFMKRIQHNSASVQSEKYASMSYLG